MTHKPTKKKSLSIIQAKKNHQGKTWSNKPSNKKANCKSWPKNVYPGNKVHGKTSSDEKTFYRSADVNFSSLFMFIRFSNDQIL